MNITSIAQTSYKYTNELSMYENITSPRNNSKLPELLIFQWYAGHMWAVYISSTSYWVNMSKIVDFWGIILTSSELRRFQMNELDNNIIYKRQLDGYYCFSNVLS